MFTTGVFRLSLLSPGFYLGGGQLAKYDWISVLASEIPLVTGLVDCQNGGKFLCQLQIKINSCHLTGVENNNELCSNLWW